MRALALGLLLLVGGLLLYGAGDLPERGAVDVPLHTRLADRYIERAYEETDTPNAVTAILGDYRSYDTLGEATVVFVAGVAAALIVRTGGTRNRE